jgi:TolA-binding protein
MGDYITIKEYAKLKGISIQAVYKQLSTDSTNHSTKLKESLKVVNGRKMLDLSVLEADNDSTNHSTSFNQPFNQIQPDSTKHSTEVESQIEQLKSQIELMKGELETKNRQIDNLLVLLNQSQQLQVITEQKLKELEDKSKETKETTTSEKDIVVADEEQQKQKQGFFKRLFVNKMI